MLHSSSADTLRNDAHQQWVETSVEVLNRPAIADALGEYGVAIITILENSYMAPRRWGQLVVPAEQLDSNNLAVHPIINSDIRLPRRKGIEWLRPDDRKFVEGEFPELVRKWHIPEDDESVFDAIHDRNSPDRFNTLHVQYSANMLAVGGLAMVPAANRMLLTAHTIYFSQLPKVVMTALMAHETDHAHVMNELLKPVPLIDQGLLGFSEEDRRRRSTHIERSSYALQYTITQAAKLDTPLTEPTIADRIQHMHPTEAGLWLKSLIHHNLPIDAKYFERFISLTAAGAVAMTRVFGAGSPLPTTAEVEGYQAMGLL